MMRMGSGGGPSPEDELHQLFRHYPNLIVALITIPYVSRVLSVERLGNVSFAQSVSTWASALCLLGVNVYGMRECARVRDDARELARVVKELLIIITATTSVVVIGFAVAIFVVPSFTSVAPLMWMFLVGTLMLSYGVEWFYQGIERCSYITVRSLAFKMLAFAATLLFARRPGDYLVYGAILALVTCGNNLFNLIRLHKLLDFKSVGRLDVRRHIMPLMVFGAQAIAQSVYLSFNSTMLGVLSHGNYQVGLHWLAVKIEHVQCSVVGAVTGVFVPRIAHDQIADDVAGFRRLVRTGFGFTMNICLAVMCYLLVFAEPVVLFVSGEAFTGAVAPVRIIGAVSLMSCVSYFVAMCILSPLGRERQMAMSSIAAAPVSVVLNLLLDGPFGAVGAGIALLATAATVLCIELWCARDVLSSFVRPRDLVRMAVSNAAAVAVSAGCAWLLATAIAGLLICSAIDIAAAVALRDNTALMLVGKARVVLRDRWWLSHGVSMSRRHMVWGHGFTIANYVWNSSEIIACCRTSEFRWCFRKMYRGEGARCRGRYHQIWRHDASSAMRSLKGLPVMGILLMICRHARGNDWA